MTGYTGWVKTECGDWAFMEQGEIVCRQRTDPRTVRA